MSHHRRGARPAGTEPTRAVAIWKRGWLPKSETFILNEMTGMKRWRPVPIGIFTVADGLATHGAFTPFRDSMMQRLCVKLIAPFAYLGAYRRTIEDGQASVIHAHFGAGAIQAMPIARRHRLPLVVTFHGRDATAEAQRGGIRGAVYRFRLRRLFAVAALILPVSEHIASELRKLGAPAERMRVHYLGVPLGDATAPVDDGREGVVFVGRLVDKKAPDLLLRAVGALPEPLRGNLPVTIIGDGPMRGHLHALADELQLGNVRFAGVQSSDAVAAALSRAAVFCLPSRTAQDGDTEGLPVSIMEAAVRGAVVVSTEHAGIPEFVVHGETGLLSPENDAAALAHNLAAVLSDPSLASRLRSAGWRRVSEGFSTEGSVRTLEGYYDEVSGARP